ncbi:DNA polymerase III subunit delta' [Mycoplasmopsis fermentans]|nr:DNA polymerase III subunit delta' [Mycoplasmopsis fermentans]VEU67029.1 DNA polymerase III subunit delta [Mesomycoplasma conjunctivae]AAD25733.1 DNA polymerase III subunit [Mycoplasmopsis fermentans]ADN69349.1 predicted DNA-directed DNA polymerase [Mycoplasmopsis fermentans JER]ADV34970.1 DNA polymerase III subunit delta [Mycoplasmopsis fermentans M64]VEU59964.1 DNA polymerase III subunit delta [Mycoplasmopsis fermentans]
MVSKNVITILENSIKNNKLSHCYLLKAPSGLNIDDSILYMINKLCNSQLQSLDLETMLPNVQIFEDNGTENNLKKDKIVAGFEESSLSSFVEGQKKITVFKNVENASKAALNSLLKIIEEPSDNVVFILTTNNITKVLETIKSRSITININAPSNEELAEELKGENLKEEAIWFYSHIFADLTQVKKYTNNESFKLIKDLLEAIEKSIKNPHYLYIFLSRFTKKDSKDTFVFLAMALRFVFSWVWTADAFCRKNYAKLLVKLKNIKFDLFNCFIVIDDFLKIQNTNANFFLQAEKMLIKLVESYA